MKELSQYIPAILPSLNPASSSVNGIYTWKLAHISYKSKRWWFFIVTPPPTLQPPTLPSDLDLLLLHSHHFLILVAKQHLCWLAVYFASRDSSAWGPCQDDKFHVLKTCLQVYPVLYSGPLHQDHSKYKLLAHASWSLHFLSFFIRPITSPDKVHCH